VSRTSAPFPVPRGAARPERSSGRRRSPEVVVAHPDEWVSDRNDRGDEPSSPPGPSLVFDLAAERSLAETIALSVLLPITLCWFWLMNAMTGRARF
jgi:hypothetical protein